MQDTVCCGCSVVCDDVFVKVRRSSLQSLGLCRLGHEYCSSIFQKTRLAKPLLKTGKGTQIPTTLAQANSKTIDLLNECKKPLFLGWSNSSIETIRVGLKLAKRLKGGFDSTASYEYGRLLEANLFGGENHLFALEHVRDFADHIIYWGVNPAESHHRHASRYTVFPKGKYIPEGRESRIISVIDIRETESMRLANHQLILTSHSGDVEFLQFLISELEGTQESVPEKVGGVPAIEFLSFAKQLREANNVALFFGNGLIHSGHSIESLPLLARVRDLLNHGNQNCWTLPMVAYCNTIGAVKASQEATNFPFTIDFSKKQPSTYDYFKEGITHFDFDCAIIVGWDALSLLPGSIAKSFQAIPIVAYSTHPTLTTVNADIVFPTALNGAEVGGTVYRMDGTAVSLKPFSKPKSGILLEGELLDYLLTTIKKR